MAPAVVVVLQHRRHESHSRVCVADRLTAADIRHRDVAIVVILEPPQGHAHHVVDVHEVPSVRLLALRSLVHRDTAAILVLLEPVVEHAGL